MKRKPVIFLDIDGVLNNHNTKERLPSGVFGIDPVNVANLNKLIQNIDIEIVLSSTWRLCYPLPVINGFLKAVGFKGLVMSRTESIIAAYHRGEEIQAWLNKNPDVDSFVILDDDSDMAHLIDHLVQTNPEVGLTVEDINKVLLFLL